ncbi:hypothetical protein P5E84_15460, partial [Clostridium perfringens]|nr:hypothetical protein [Clostridium perfringens]
NEQVELKSGVEVISRNYDYDVTIPYNGSQQLSFNETITAAFAESDILASNKFVSRVGARAEHNSLTNSVSLDPRVSLAYKAGNNGQVSLAFGTFRQ